MVKKIVTIGLDLAGDSIEQAEFMSKTSLLDWDIILFKPDIQIFGYHREDYLGKPCLDDRGSFKVREACEHWKREIVGAVESGKTVLVFLRVCGHSGFPFGLISDSNFQKGVCDEREAFCIE